MLVRMFTPLMAAMFEIFDWLSRMELETCVIFESKLLTSFTLEIKMIIDLYKS